MGTFKRQINVLRQELKINELTEKEYTEPKLEFTMKRFESIEYRGGHPNFPKPCTANIDVNATTVRIRKAGFFDNSFVLIKKEDIVNVSFEDKGSRSVGKAAVGAVVGGVLTGGIGLILGGAIGAMKKDVSNLYITIKYNNHEYDVIIKAGKKAAEIYGAIANIL